MQYYYSYDKITKEYVGKGVADINPEATKRLGKEVFWAPAYSTLIEPPKLKEHQVAVFENGVWVTKHDYRGCLICNEQLDISMIQEIGSLPKGHILISETEAKQIQNDKLWYVIDKGKLVKNPNYEEQKTAERKEHISRLAMARLDFFNFVCQPKGLKYIQLCQILESNDSMLAVWNLCTCIHRGDEILCKFLKDYLPDITDDELDTIFEQHGKVINE